MNCIICEKKFENNILFEDDNIMIMLAIEPSVNGHIQIFSREHYTIMEQVPDDVVNKMVSAANKMSIVLFESMKVHGTNIIINNGVPAGQKVPHFSIDILPRRTDDNLKLDWTLKQATPEALDSIHRIIEEGMNKPEEIITYESENKKDDSPDKKRTDAAKEGRHDDGDNSGEDADRTNYYHQIFERIP